MNIFFKNIFLLSFPALYTILLIFLGLLFKNDIINFGPFLALHGIFFWFLFTPNLLGPIIILFLGLLHDIIYLTHLGSTPLIFLLIILSINIYKNIFQEASFFDNWFFFLLLFIVCNLLFWLLNSFIHLTFLPFKSIFNEFFLNLLFFPLNYFLCNLFLQKLKLKKYKNV